ncbi:MAG: cache domain-containing protein [Alphaproteobacteria bacterium]|nr:cache domain-containing protein [Alphaproteobacteria bacterium]
MMAALVACGLTFGASTVRAAEGECWTAQLLVDKAISHYKAVGQEKAFADFMDKGNPGWVNNGHYVVVSTMDGIFKTHTVNPKFIDNTDLPMLKDTDGILIIQEMVKAGKSGPDGAWAKYTWVHPEAKKWVPKHTWVKPSGELLFMDSCYP